MRKYWPLFILGTFFLLSAKEPKLPKSIKKDFSYIPTGVVITNADTLSLQDFFILNREVTNAEYQNFLNKIKNSVDEKTFASYQIQSEYWTTKASKSEMASYFTDPKYADFPVVNVTYKGAEAYCAEMTKMIKTLFKKVQLNIHVRLPMHFELIRSAVGDDFQNQYPWEKGAKASKYANIENAKQGVFLQKVKQLKGSEFDVYDLVGNAAEMTNQPGIAVGGAFNSSLANSGLHNSTTYNHADPTVGFRVVFTWRDK